MKNREKNEAKRNNDKGAKNFLFFESNKKKITTTNNNEKIGENYRPTLYCTVRHGIKNENHSFGYYGRQMNELG